MARRRTGRRDGDEYAPKLGYGAASKEAHFVAAPLLTAAALSLAGVVAGADDEFRWPGATLVLLVVTAMTLIFSMQLAYNARLHLFAFGELKDHYDGLRPGGVPESRLQQEYQAADTQWRQGQRRAVWVYNAGTTLLGLGVAASLAPPECGKQAAWRWTAAAIVLAGTAADTIWVFWKLRDLRD
ncbi:hypothetical protein ABT121_33510 [Streptomyces sp. NPDC001928]|uniref:hypothetical protein n=1 Tax=Streptomyces sp. NPDC001928 TaxID=3154404 RepID=UPI00332BF20F